MRVPSDKLVVRESVGTRLVLIVLTSAVWLNVDGSGVQHLIVFAGVKVVAPTITAAALIRMIPGTLLLLLLLRLV